MGGEIITKFALHERQSAKATFIFNKSQNLALSKIGKLHIFKYAQSKHLKAWYKQPHVLQIVALFAIFLQWWPPSVEEMMPHNL